MPFIIPRALERVYSVIGKMTTPLPKSMSSTFVLGFMEYLFLIDAGITIWPLAETVIVILSHLRLEVYTINYTMSSKIMFFHTF